MPGSCLHCANACFRADLWRPLCNLRDPNQKCRAQFWAGRRRRPRPRKRSRRRCYLKSKSICLVFLMLSENKYVYNMCKHIYICFMYIIYIFDFFKTGIMFWCCLERHLRFLCCAERWNVQEKDDVEKNAEVRPEEGCPHTSGKDDGHEDGKASETVEVKGWFHSYVHVCPNVVFYPVRCLINN